MIISSVFTGSTAVVFLLPFALIAFKSMFDKYHKDDKPKGLLYRLIYALGIIILAIVLIGGILDFVMWLSPSLKEYYDSF